LCPLKNNKKALLRKYYRKKIVQISQVAETPDEEFRRQTVLGVEPGCGDLGQVSL
jgi:hypothetical protein